MAIVVYRALSPEAATQGHLQKRHHHGGGVYIGGPEPLARRSGVAAGRWQARYSCAVFG